MPPRRLSADEAALWARVMAGVRPLAGVPPSADGVAPKPLARAAAAPVAAVPPALRPRAGRTEPEDAPRALHNTLDGSWDRQLSRGAIAPDRTIDLHGHSLASAYALLDGALGDAIHHGERVLLLVTGKPPLPASERPHQRGAIRAAVGDWLAGSRHGAAIAAVRPAHPRHGGAGALYIVLRKARPTRKS